MPRRMTARNVQIESLEPLVLMSANTIDGTDAGEWISGTDADDTINAGGGDDEIHAPAGNNIIDGGEGIDRFVVYEGTQQNFRLDHSSDGSVLLSGIGLSGVPTSSRLINVEQILFTDGLLDLSEGEIADNPVSVPADLTSGQADDLLPADVQLSVIEADTVSQPDVVMTPSSILSASVAQQNGGNINPLAASDSFIAEKSETLFGNVATNDVDPDGRHYLLSFRLVQGTQYGTLNLYGDGSFDYATSASSRRADAFVYEVTDEAGGKSIATATIAVRGADAGITGTSTEAPVAVEPPVVVEPPVAVEPPVVVEPPVAVEPPVVVSAPISRPVVAVGPDANADIFDMSPSTLLTGDLLENDGDENKIPLYITEFSKTQHGALTVGTDGSFSYYAGGGYVGIDFFHYVVSDGTQTDRATVVIRIDADGQSAATATEMFETNMVVSPIVFDLNNDGVINVTGETTGRDKSEITEVGHTVQFDIDGDGNKEAIEWVEGSGDGILVDTTKFRGTNINGLALFGDEGGRYANGFEKLAELDANGNGLIEKRELSRLKLWLDDGDGQLQANELDTLQQHGLISISTQMTVDGDGLMRSWAFTRNDDMILIEDVWFAEEGDTASAEEAVDRNVAPDADADVISGSVNQILTGNVLSNDRDPDGDTLRVIANSRPVHGSLSMDDNGRFTYTPDGDFTGVDYIQYQISDGHGGTDTAVLTLVVNGDSAAGAQKGNTVNGTVWLDLTGAQATASHDGLQDAAETVRGTSVFVSLLDVNGIVLQSVHTDGSGQYKFDGLQDGVYQVKVSIASLPGQGRLQGQLTLKDVNSNFFDAVDSDFDQKTGESGLIVLGGPGESLSSVTVDAGYYFA